MGTTMRRGEMPVSWVDVRRSVPVGGDVVEVRLRVASAAPLPAAVFDALAAAVEAVDVFVGELDGPVDAQQPPPG